MNLAQGCCLFASMFVCCPCTCLLLQLPPVLQRHAQSAGNYIELVWECVQDETHHRPKTAERLQRAPCPLVSAAASEDGLILIQRDRKLVENRCRRNQFNESSLHKSISHELIRSRDELKSKYPRLEKHSDVQTKAPSF